MPQFVRRMIFVYCGKHYWLAFRRRFSEIILSCILQGLRRTAALCISDVENNQLCTFSLLLQFERTCLGQLSGSSVYRGPRRKGQCSGGVI